MHTPASTHTHAPYTLSHSQAANIEQDLESALDQERTAKEAAITALAAAEREVEASKTTVSDLEVDKVQVAKELTELEETCQELTSCLTNAEEINAELTAKLATEQVKVGDISKALDTAKERNLLTVTEVRTPGTCSKTHSHTDTLNYSNINPHNPPHTYIDTHTYIFTHTGG
jgi:chromosome segregation ATPase